jgi:nicotine blue oxidoreductase
VERAQDLLLGAGCSPVVVVLGADATAVRAVVDLPESVVNPDWPTGLGSSLRVGLDALAGRADAAVVVLADQPRMTREAVRRVWSAWEDRPGGAVVATYDGRPGHPVLLDAAAWDEVRAGAVGDVGARAFLQAHPERVTRVACDDVADPRDIDTPADLRALRDDGPLTSD